MDRNYVSKRETVMILPLLFGMEGIWFSVVVSESLAFLLGVAFLIIKKKIFDY